MPQALASATDMPAHGDRFSIDRDFGQSASRHCILIEFADPSVAPALASAADGTSHYDVRTKLETACSLSLVPASGPAVAAQAAGRFATFQSSDERPPLEVVDSVSSELGDKVLTVLPVPDAIPAIGPSSGEPKQWPTFTPDFHTLQGYAASAPIGLGFADVGQLEGADGTGITVLDLEGGWILDHEALQPVRYSLWSGSPSEASGWLEHGTAVSSILTAPRMGEGIFGLVPAARGALASIFESGAQHVAAQLMHAQRLLQPGDVVLMEVQRPGPTTEFQPDADQHGYIPTSFWPDVRAAVRSCVSSGISVVEVGGNGGIDLGDPVLQGGFGQAGSTENTLGDFDSGSIMVGAGHAPGETNGLAPMPFSNFGDRLDCQAWGERVVCAGYGDLWGEPLGKTSYTRNFFGTSSAAPLIAAVVGAIQGRHLRKYGAPLPPLVLRQALACYGTPQAGQATNRIGPQPDLAELFDVLGLY